MFSTLYPMSSETISQDLLACLEEYAQSFNLQSIEQQGVSVFHNHHQYLKS